MLDTRKSEPKLYRANPRLFIGAGVFTFVQVFLIGLLKFGIAAFPEQWLSLPGILSQVMILLGLVGLGYRTAPLAPRLTRASKTSIWIASVILGLAVLALVSEGPLPPESSGSPGVWLPILVAAFIISLIAAYIFSALACGNVNGMRSIGYLLGIPVASLGFIMVVGILTSIGDALRLDFYTNAVNACAYIAIGVILKSEKGSDRWQKEVEFS